MLINLFTKRDAFILNRTTLIAAKFSVEREGTFLFAGFERIRWKFLQHVSFSYSRCKFELELNDCTVHINSNDKAICDLRSAIWENEVSVKQNKDNKENIICLVTKSQTSQVLRSLKEEQNPTSTKTNFLLF